MQGSHLVAALLAGVLVGGGVWIGASVFGDDARVVSEEPDLGGPPASVTEAPAPPPMLGTSGDDMARRMRALEQRMSALETLIAAKAKELAPMMRLYEQARASGMIAADGTPVAGGVVVADGPAEFDEFGDGYTRTLGKKLGLDPARKKAMEDALDGMLDKLKALEKENATVSTKGDTTTITIQPYNGDTVKRDWDDWVARNLTAEEQTKLKKEHAANRLFGNRLGAHARKIEIKEEGGMIDVTESGSAGDDEEVTRMQMQGPAAARELVLEPYAHLLK